MNKVIQQGADRTDQALAFGLRYYTQDTDDLQSEPSRCLPRPALVDQEERSRILRRECDGLRLSRAEIPEESLGKPTLRHLLNDNPLRLPDLGCTGPTRPPEHHLCVNCLGNDHLRVELPEEF